MDNMLVKYINILESQNLVLTNNVWLSANCEIKFDQNIEINTYRNVAVKSTSII